MFWWGEIFKGDRARRIEKICAEKRQFGLVCEEKRQFVPVFGVLVKES